MSLFGFDRKPWIASIPGQMDLGASQGCGVANMGCECMGSSDSRTGPSLGIGNNQLPVSIHGWWRKRNRRFSEP
jgi:hypothetical protein